MEMRLLNNNVSLGDVCGWPPDAVLKILKICYQGGKTSSSESTDLNE